MALALEDIGWGTADHWMRMQASYALAQARRERAANRRGLIQNGRQNRDYTCGFGADVRAEWLWFLIRLCADAQMRDVKSARNLGA